MPHDEVDFFMCAETRQMQKSMKPHPGTNVLWNAQWQRTRAACLTANEFMAGISSSLIWSELTTTDMLTLKGPTWSLAQNDQIWLPNVQHLVTHKRHTTATRNQPQVRFTCSTHDERHVPDYLVRELGANPSTPMPLEVCVAREAIIIFTYSRSQRANLWQSCLDPPHRGPSFWLPLHPTSENQPDKMHILLSLSFAHIIIIIIIIVMIKDANFCVYVYFFHAKERTDWSTDWLNFISQWQRY